MSPAIKNFTEKWLFISGLSNKALNLLPLIELGYLLVFPQHEMHLPNYIDKLSYHYKILYFLYILMSMLRHNVENLSIVWKSLQLMSQGLS